MLLYLYARAVIFSNGVENKIDFQPLYIYMFDVFNFRDDI